MERGSIFAQAIVCGVSLTSLILIGATRLDHSVNCPEPVLPTTECLELTPEEMAQRQRDAIALGSVVVGGIVVLVGSEYISEKVDEMNIRGRLRIK